MTCGSRYRIIITPCTCIGLRVETHRHTQPSAAAVFPVELPLGIAKLIRKTQWALFLRLRYRPVEDEESRARRVKSVGNDVRIQL